jgi:hypothetical protein
MLIGPNVLAACVMFTIIIRFIVCLSNTGVVTIIAYYTAVATDLYNDANSDISSHQNVKERWRGTVKETGGSKSTELVKIMKRVGRMNEKCGEKTGSCKELKKRRNRK